MIYYRYLRPAYYSFQRNEVKIDSCGGVCFRFEGHTEEADGSFMTYSMCHQEEMFSKEVARRIADERAEHGIGFQVKATVNTAQKACDEVLSIIDKYAVASKLSESAREFYLASEMRVLVMRINQIWATHRRASELVMLDRSTIEALNLKARYEANYR